MGITSRRRGAPWIVALGLSVFGAVAAVAWQPGATMPFTLPGGGSAQPPIWSGPVAKRVAIRTSTTSGEVRVEAPIGTGRGHVPSGATLIVEGNFPNANVFNASATASAEGSTQTSTDDGLASPNRTVGSGSVALGGGGTFGYYYAPMAPVCRLTTVQAGSAAVDLTDGQNRLAGLEAGDWSFAVKTTQKFGLSGGGTSVIGVYDLPTGTAAAPWQYQGNASAQPGDPGDSIFADGTANLSITLTNSGPGELTLVTCTGGSEPTTPLAPGQQTEVHGNITAFAWSYQAPGTNVTILVKKP